MEPITRKTSVGVIGAGYWGVNLIRNFDALPACELKYVCDTNPARLEKYRHAYKHIEFVSDPETLFSDPALEVVVIATPVRTHFDLAKKALLSGKHVFVEKPMTETSAQARGLIALAREKKLILHVDHTFVYYGPVIKIKELVDSGELGDLHYFDSQRINLGIIQPDVNVYWDLAPHDISILNYLYDGVPKIVTAMGTQHIVKKNVELAHITIQYESGFVAHIHVSWLSPVKLRQMTIGGRKKMIYFDDIHPFEKIKVYNKGVDLTETDLNTFEPVYRSGDVNIPLYDGREALERECSHFLESVVSGEDTITNGEAGLAVVRILEAADLSLLNGGSSIKLL